LTDLSLKNRCSLDTFKERIKGITTRKFIYDFGEATWNDYLNYIQKIYQGEFIKNGEDN
jgi:hypothetical protein